MKWKKLAALGLGIATVGLLVGCGGDEATETDGNEVVETPTREPIRVMAPFFGEIAPEENSAVQQKIEDFTGFEIDMTWIPESGYTDRLSLVLAGGDDVPDVLVVPGEPISNPTIVSSVAAGGFWQLDDYIDDFNYLSMMNPDVRMNASFNGETFGLYRTRDLIRTSITIRRDWLDNLGLDTPTTIDEFTEMLFAFRDQDPDGNGMDDTYGITLPSWDGMNNAGPLDAVAVMFGAPNRTAIVDGEVIFDFMTPEYMEAMEWLRMLFEEGLINRDFVTLPTDDWNNDFLNDNAGVIIDNQSRSMELARLMGDANDVEDGSPWVTQIGNLTTPNVNAILPTTGFNGLNMIPTTSVTSEERLLEVLEFLNLLNSEEMTAVLNIGVEDLHWHFNDEGEFERIINEDEGVHRQDMATIASFAQISMGVSGFQFPVASTGNEIETERIAIRDGQHYRDIAVFNPTQPFISETETMRGAILQNIIADARIQFIAGQIDREGFEAEVQRWLDSGGQDVIEELTELYQAAQ